MRHPIAAITFALLIAVLADSQTATAQTTHNVATSGFTFVPANVTIDVGDSVQWTGLGGGLHTVAEVDDGSATVYNGGFHSASLATDFLHTFNTPGTFYYICEPHVLLGMRGTVTVVEPIEVPTVSEWGLLAMLLLTLSAGTILVAKQRRRGGLPI